MSSTRNFPIKTKAFYNTIKKSAQRALISIYTLTITRDIKRIRRVQGSGLVPKDNF